MIRSRRIGLAHAGLALFAIGVVVQSARVQLVQGRAWRARAERQQQSEHEVPAPRGAILDASGLALAESHEVVQLEIAPREVREPAKLRKALVAAKVPKPFVTRALDRRRAWVTLPGRYLAVDVAPALALRGVHPTSAVIRSYAMSQGTRRIVGRVDPNTARPLDGVELALDSVLRGAPGQSTLLRDVRGRSFESPTAPGVAATPGHTVVLTIRHELQEIVEHSLDEAVSKLNAEGGDIVILDPRSGEVLAMASHRRDPRATAATALTEPFEPGSTMKPFIAAGLLERRRAKPDDYIETGNGVLEVNGREIHDDHLIGRATLADVLRWSSNVGIVRFAQRLSAREEFETLRDFGFGAPTGVPYPSESNGTLREPKRWSTQSAASLAMGYEVAATPMQLAVAYAAIANGGELLEPALVKEVRAPDGTVRYRHERRVVRRVMSPAVAEQLRKMLLGVVEEGTAAKADVASYQLAGKTGTPRRTVNGRYVPTEYNPNFAGIFPGDKPQYVIVVKLTAPHGEFYAASTAAPVTRAVLEAAIAARDAALDRGELASVARGDSGRLLALQQGATGAARNADSAGRRTPDVGATASGVRRPAERVADAEAEQVADEAPYVVSLPVASPRGGSGEAPRPVPDVRGLSLRDAVRSLHSAGFRVQLARGPAGLTVPAAGSVAASGSLVRLLYDY